MFELKKLQITDNGAKVTYVTEEAASGSVYYKDIAVKKTAQPHPDLGNELQELSSFVGLVLKKEDISNIVIGGVARSGIGEKEKVKIDVAYNGSEFALKFYTQAGMYDFEEKLQEQLTAIEEEARLYIVEGKVAQLEMMFDENND